MSRSGPHPKANLPPPAWEQIGPKETTPKKQQFFPWRIWLRSPELPIPPEARIIGAVMMACFDERKGECFPSTETLVRLSGLGINRIWRARKWLVENGYFVRIGRQNREGRLIGQAYKPTGKMFSSAPDAKALKKCDLQSTVPIPVIGTVETTVPMPTVPIPVIGTEGVRTSRRSKSTSFDKNKEQEPSALSKNDGDGDKSLLEILEINGDRIPGKDQPGLAYLIRAYQEAGRPASGKAIADWLDSKLKWLTRDGGMSYPKVFLWRLKQIQRGRFEVRSAEVASTAGILERMSMTAELRACLRPCIAALLNDRGSLSAKCARLLAWDEQKKLSLTAEERSALLRVTNSSDGGETSDGKRDGHSEGL